jgi:hypothetical protein
MMIEANGENRRWAAYAIGGAVLAALGTKLGEWAVEELRKRAGRPGTAKAGGDT